MAIIKPVYYDQVTGGFKEAKAGDQIDASISQSQANDSNTLIFTDPLAEMFVGDVIGVSQETADQFTAIVKASSENRVVPLGIIYSKVGTGTIEYKARLTGVLKLADVVGGTITLSRAGLLWLQSNGSVGHTVPAQVANGQITRMGVAISSTLLSVNIHTLLYT